MFLNHLYGDVNEPKPKIIDVFMCKLRRKHADTGVVIDAIWVQGYILREMRGYDAVTVSARPALTAHPITPHNKLRKTS